MNVLGLDIGGANTKAAFITTKNGVVDELRIATKYFPVWKDPERLGVILSELKNKLSGSENVDAVGLTMTAELSDAYQTKREGVNQILTHAAKVFPVTPILVLDVNAKFKSLNEAKSEPLKVAAANWVATSWMVSNFARNCIVVDVGSTTTSIIPVIEGEVAAAGKTDLEKLLNGELVYTGSLRTNVAAIVNHIPIREAWARVSSELFAQSGDAHLVLGNIKEDEYTVETADGRGKTRAYALARLARVLCADTEMLAEEEIVNIAEYIYERQIDQIAEALSQVYNSINTSLRMSEIQIIVTGLGRNFLARKAAKKVGFKKILELNELVGTDVATVSTAVGVVWMTASKLEGRTVQWTR